MASGDVNRTNRPNTWLHRPTCKREKSLANSEPSTHGTKQTFRDSSYFVRFRGKADIQRLKRDRRLVVTSAVAENDARYVVRSGGAANGGRERWNSTHMCRCSSPLARPAAALMAWPPATARQASPSRRVRAQRSSEIFSFTACTANSWRMPPSRPRESQHSRASACDPRRDAGVYPNRPIREADILELTAKARHCSNRPSNREVEHVPAYSHSNRWVGVGGACSNKWIGIGEIRGSQGNRNYRRGPVRLAQRSRNESVAAAP